MIVDVYKYFKKHPGYNKLIGDDFLFVEYKCPLNIEEFQLWSKSHLITYVINGKKDWITSTKTYQINAGEALFARKGIYTTKQYLEEDYCVMLFFITDTFIKNFITENKLSKNVDLKENYQSIYPINANDSFNVLIESMFHYLKQFEEIPQSLIELKFKELLFNIILNPKNNQLLNFFSSVNQETKTTIENVMTTNFQHNLKIEDFAKLCGRSLSAFKRDFKNNFKTTPSKWLITKRLEHSKTLLIGTNMSVNEVCYESGFKNPSHFIHAFKNKYNITPKQLKLNTL